MSDWKMQREEVEKLISLYRQNKCLWDYRNSEYKRTDLKRNAWQKLSDIFGKEVNEVKRKVKHLRSSYVSEKKKVDEYFGVIPAYRPNLFYYDDMSFLDPIIVLRKTFNFEKYENTDPIADFNEEPVDNTISEDYITEQEAPTPPLSPQRPPQSHNKLKKKKHRLAPYYSKLNAAVNTLADISKSTSEDSVYTAFGKTLALQLSQLSPIDATVTMSEIYQVLSKNVLQSMMSKSRGTFSRGKKETVVGHTERKLSLSLLTESFENETDADNQPSEFDEASL